MLDRHTRAVALALISLFLAPTLAAAGSTAERVAAAKQADRDGYRPALFKEAANVVSETEPNDQPADADSVDVGDVMVASFGAPGDEDWFEITASSAGYLALSTTASDTGPTDTVLEVYDAVGDRLLAFDDDGGAGLFSALPHLAVDTEQMLLVRIRHYGGLGGDGYELHVEVGTPPPPAPANDLVAGAVEVECNKSTLGTTVGSGDSFSDLDCLPLESKGGDVFYQVVLPYSNQLNVQATPGTSSLDPAVFLFTDPTDPAGSCIAAADDAFAGESEIAVYTNEDYEDGLLVYIGIDSWAPASAGDFVLQVDCDFVVPTESTNWSALKANW